MPVQVVTKSQYIQNSNKKIKELYMLDFKFQHSASGDKALMTREVVEFLCWSNSPIKTQAENIGWVDDVSKLPKYDNNELYLPHHIYYSKHMSLSFLTKHCPHVQALAREEHDYYNSSAKRVGGRHAAA